MSRSLLYLSLISLPFLAGAVIHAPVPHSANTGASYWNRGRGYTPFKYASPEGIVIANTTSEPVIDSVNLTSCGDFRLSFRIDNRNSHPSRRYRYTDRDGQIHHRKTPPWAFFLTDSDGTRLWFTVCPPDADPAGDPIRTVADAPRLYITSTPPAAGGLLPGTSTAETTIDEANLPPQKVPFSGETLWTVESRAGHLRIIAGTTDPVEITDIPISVTAKAFGFAASPAAEITVSDISFIPSENPRSINRHVSGMDNEPATFDPAQLHDIIRKSADPLVGYWEIFDRTLEESLLKLGGDYRLAIVRNDDRYDIIYISGARVNGTAWEPGMLKGTLTPTSFPGILNLKWIDAEGKPLSYSISAQTGYNETMTLQFPYHSSTLRLRKVEAYP